MAAGFRWVDGKATSLDDTWEWDGTTWRLIEIPGPGARDHVSMTYDASRGQVVLHGGGRPESGLVGDTWTYDGVRWTRLANSGPPRARHRLMYSTNQSATILYGGWGDDGKRHSDVLVLRDTTWRPVTPPGRR